MNWKRYRRFLGDLDDPIIVYHRDADGVCSAAILSDYIGCDACLPNDGDGIGITQDLIDIVNDHASAVFLDLPVDQLDVLKKLDVEKTFILDHHPPEEDLTNKNILHVNPRFEEGTYLPAAYLTHRMVDGEVEGATWKAGVGVIGDHGVEGCRDLMDEIDEKHPNLLPDNRHDREEIHKSTLGIISQMIDASKVIKGEDGIGKSLQVIKRSSSPDEVLKSKLSDWYEKYKSLLENEKRRFQDESRYFPKTDAYMYELGTSYSLTSTLSTVLADEKEDSVIVIYKVNNGMNLSGRCQSGQVDVSKVLKKAVGKRGRAGGHPQAAGGHVERGKEEVVLERLKEIFEGLADL